MEPYSNPIYDYSIQAALQKPHAKIDGQRQIKGALAREHTLYSIQIAQKSVLDPKSEYKTVERRYKDFEDLHNAIKEERKGIILPALPPKHYGMNLLFGPSGVQSDRKTELELYLNKLMTNREVWDIDAFVDFTTKVGLLGAL